MGLTPLKRVFVSEKLLMTYKVHNPRHLGDVGLDNTTPNVGNSPELNGGPTQQPRGKPNWF